MTAISATRLYAWLNRYGLAECAGIAAALLASFTARRTIGSAIAVAYAGAWGETLGFAVFMFARDYFSEAHTARAAGRSMGLRGAGEVVGGLVTEFGPAGLLDTFVTRPFAMGVGARLLGPQVGVVAGKLAADVVFYVPVIFMYERRKRWRGSVIESP